MHEKKDERIDSGMPPFFSRSQFEEHVIDEAQDHLRREAGKFDSRF